MRPFLSTCSRLTVFLLIFNVCCGATSAESPLKFKVMVLAIDANEGCDVGDVDGDGRPDVVAGRSWFRNGQWTPRPLRLIEDRDGYVESNGDFLLDVNGDGRLDVVAGSFFDSEVAWFENPGGEGLERGLVWRRHVLADTGLSANEFSLMHDLDGDHTPEWITNSWVKQQPLKIWRFARDENETQPWKLESHTLNKQLTGVGQGHGMGVGDVNNDGREDIIVGSGWYERPAGDYWSLTWKFHADWDRPLSCPVLVHDVNNDGLADILWGNPHDYGLYVWLSRGADEHGKLKFDEQLIDDEYSQLHALHLADLDGDGTDELITGKRVRAHNGNDPGGDQLPRLCYYELGPTAANFQRHDIDLGHVGIGLQIRTADLNADGKLDIVVAGKDGTQILFQE